MIVIYEATALQGDFLSYLLRSLLSEGRIAYETVEKTSEGMHVRRIEREGPTGLLCTTTAISLHPENETGCQIPFLLERLREPNVRNDNADHRFCIDKFHRRWIVRSIRDFYQRSGECRGKIQGCGSNSNPR